MSTYERHVLLVDDDKDTRDAITALLQAKNVRVTTATGGADALRQMEQGLHPDLIIADIAMPQMDGFEFFERLRANDQWITVPFIALTALNDKATMRRAMTLGVDGFLTKPLNMEQLLLTIYNRVKRTQELTRYAEAAQEMLDHARRDMARMFTHELKTPLVSLNMVTELLTRHSEDLSKEQAHELIESLEAGNTRLNRLLRQMELVIQLDTGELKKLIHATARPGPLWDALTAAVSRARSFSYRQRDVPVIYDTGNTGGQIAAEWNSLTHALAEILSNAMAFSPVGSSVQVRQWSDQGYAHLSFSDSGPGIAQEQRNDLFRRFRQIEREKHDQQGIGMGLYLARSIVEAMGGTLSLVSEEGHGTTVTVSLPLLGVPPGQAGPPQLDLEAWLTQPTDVPPVEVAVPEHPAPPAPDPYSDADLRAIFQDDE